ncbi:hypothetical protein [Paenibacillus sp. J45TS6]|uniref:hypothetical protein n=1 Tax=Paenibacillus sp. J45TS6 TaxID=2807196 RepID=UPI001BCF2C33|nr:hypothetical protein [Paenibacillus sp. J45TS6]
MKCVRGILTAFCKCKGVGPVVYLCPDKQLVEQAIEQAAIHNIPVVTINQEPSQAAE